MPSKLPAETAPGTAAWEMRSDQVRLRVTKTGGHLAPVTFRLGEREVQPYSLPPWHPDDHTDQPALLQVLRGDFFCFPFGGDNEGHPPHGDTANREWTLCEETDLALVFEMPLASMRGSVRKTIRLLPGHTALYQEHVISGVEGRFNYGHHPILHVPEGVTARISCSPFQYGAVYPGTAGNPAMGEYGCLKPSARFRSLAKVPLAAGGTTSLAEYPAREGFEDIAMMSTRPDRELAWTAVVLDGYVWLAIRRPVDFPSTLFWMSNGGRHFPPWNGVHRRRIGVEDVCGHFCDGVDLSRQDLLAEQGIPTTLEFSPSTAVALRHIQVVAEVPEGFGSVQRLTMARSRVAARLTSDTGMTVKVPVDLGFLWPEAHA